MATLRVSASCVDAVLKRVLGASVSAVRAGVENKRASISVTKLLTFTFKLWCDEPNPGRRLRIHYEGSLGSGVVLAFARKRILEALPFVEKIQDGECVIDLEKIEISGKRLSDCIDVDAIQMPAADDFCTIQFSIKENATCPS
jgi:hypothetical protein